MFEIHLDRPPGRDHWRWVDAWRGHWTLITAHPAREPTDRCYLRFRAEREGDTTLRFEKDGDVGAVTVHIAPESD